MPTLGAGLHVRAWLHLVSWLVLLARADHNRRRLLTRVGRPCLPARLPLIARVADLSPPLFSNN